MRLKDALKSSCVLTGIVCCALSIGCSSTKPNVAAPVQPTSASIDHIISAAAFGEPEGLEIRWWIVRDSTEAIAAALEPYLHQPLPISSAMSEQLRESGLRLVAIPTSDLLGLRSRLPLVGRIDRRWVGQTVAWTEGVTGPTFRGSRTIRIGFERLTISSGALRLLMRVWKDPGASTAQLRLDFAVQHLEAAAQNSQRSMLELSAGRNALDDGILFSSTLTEMSIGDAYCYLLVPEAPEREWTFVTEDEDGDEDAAAEEEATTSDGEPKEPASWSPEPEVESTLVQGPPAAGTPTLGELMLMQPVDPVTGRQLRAVIVLVPRVHDPQSLLP